MESSAADDQKGPRFHTGPRPEDRGAPPEIVDVAT
jgi:hypothetical protein